MRTFNIISQDIPGFFGEVRFFPSPELLSKLGSEAPRRWGLTLPALDLVALGWLPFDRDSTNKTKGILQTLLFTHIDNKPSFLPSSKTVEFGRFVNKTLTDTGKTRKVYLHLSQPIMAEQKIFIRKGNNKVHKFKTNNWSNCCSR